MRIKISFVVEKRIAKLRSETNVFTFQTIAIISYIADVKLPYGRSTACVGQKYLKLCDDLGLPNHKNTEKKNKKHKLLQLKRQESLISVGSYFQTIKNTLIMARLKKHKIVKKLMKINKIGF